MITRLAVAAVVIVVAGLGFTYPKQAGAALLRVQSLVGQLTKARAQALTPVTETGLAAGRKRRKADVVGVLLGMEQASVAEATKSAACVERLRTFAGGRQLDYQDFTCDEGATALSGARSVLRVEYSKKQRVYRVSYSQEVNMGFQDFHTRAYAVFSDYSSSNCTHAERNVIEPIGVQTWCYSRGDGSVFAVSRQRDRFKLMLADRRIRDDDSEISKEPRF